ncbi:MAG: NAD-dependent epimerase/dehydratase family protein [Opitutaceae bacterium]|nr:NAD-dependent epimerase/dehydratase family protein [Opitutaceae bacterium]
MSQSSKTILITGGAGNIARLLAKRLLQDGHAITCLDIVEPSLADKVENVEYETADICDESRLESLLDSRKPDLIFHLASLLSGSSEVDRRRAFQINAIASFNLLELSQKHNPSPTVVFPGTGASYGSGVPSELPETYEQWPENIYGATKVAVERLGVYYKLKHGLDFRCLRPPLVLSPFAPQSALTAYASHAYVAAFNGKPFSFPVAPDIGMSTIYIQDLVEGFVQLAFAPKESLKQHAYNLHAFCPSAQEVADSIKRHRPDFEYTFKPNEIVESMLRPAPNKFQDDSARRDWGWNPRFELDDCTRDIFELLKNTQ